MLKISLALLALLTVGCGEKERADITIRVAADNVPAEERVHIAGNQRRVGQWNMPHKPMEKSDSLWALTLPAEIGSEFSFKITRGNWRTEAVDSNGYEFPNYTFVVDHDTTINLRVAYWRDTHRVAPLISKGRFEKKGWSIELWENWRFQAGDDSAWATPDFDDSNWLIVDARLAADHLPASWDGLGWFRLHLQVDSSIVGFPLSLLSVQAGAADIFLDGKKLFSIGAPAATLEQERSAREQNPRPIVFTTAGHHLLSVRYSNHQKQILFMPRLFRGFEMWLGHLDNAIFDRITKVRWASKLQLIFSVLPISFAVVHLLLFIFYPQNKNNLYYALSMLGFAGMVIAAFQEAFAGSMQSLSWIILTQLISTILAISFGIMAVYATIYSKMSKVVYVPFVALSLLVVLVLFFRLPFDIFQIVLYVMLGLAIFDMSRLTFISGRQNKDWGWIISAGFTTALLIFAYQVLIGVGLIRPIGGQMLVWVYSIPVIAVSLSIYISLNFAKAHKSLQVQLERVQQLSDEKIERERQAQESEIQKRLLEADNARKTKELEEARQLQLAMVPKELPRLPNLAIAVSMAPATEVGGDYYDFHTTADGALTIAIGDATGHGMKAGTMVAAIKSLFSANGGIQHLAETLSAWSAIIRQMNLGNLYMAMSLWRVQGKHVVLSNAGMPPALLYHAKEKTVEEIILKGMPLGGAADFVYEESSFAVKSGDTLLLLSDGFTELFNENSDMYGERAIVAFRAVAQNSPQEIVDALNHECRIWRGDRPQFDDITFVVVKFL